MYDIVRVILRGGYNDKSSVKTGPARPGHINFVRSGYVYA